MVPAVVNLGRGWSCDSRLALYLLGVVLDSRALQHSFGELIERFYRIPRLVNRCFAVLPLCAKHGNVYAAKLGYFARGQFAGLGIIFV